MRRFLVTLSLFFASACAAAAQTVPPPAGTARPPEPALRRWFEFQQLVLGARYRLIRNSAGLTTSDHGQYREQIRARVNLDARKRYTVNTGVFSGNQFIGSWNNLGPGTGAFDGHDHYMRQLFVSASPAVGLEAQAGGLYVNRGETTEYTSYDDDGYLVGARVSVRRPKALYFDEVAITHGGLTSTATPNLWRRWDDVEDRNYTQVLAAKRFSPTLSASVDYTNHAHTDTFRGGVALRFKANAPVSGLRYEQYVRTSDPEPAAGFSVGVERPVTKWVRLQGGFASIDEHYGGLNADRIQRGRRWFAVANVPIHGPLSASIFATRALHEPYALSNRTRIDAVLAWDILNTLRQTGVF